MTKPLRRTFLIQRRFQLKYILVIVIAGAAISMLFGAIMYQAHVEVSEMAFATATRNSERDRIVLALVIATAVLLAATLATFGVLITHRVAGPIFVLGRYVKLLGEGRYPALRPLRRDDELQEFYEAFHEAVDKMRARDRDEGQALSVAIERLSPLADTEETRAALEDLRAIVARKLESSGSAVPATDSVFRIQAARRQES